MTIKALLEAGKALPEGEWEVGSMRLDNVLWDAVFDKAGNLIAYVDGEEKAELMVAARNALPEIEELLEWVQKHGAHGEFCAHYDNDPCTCDFDRIREMVER